MALVFVVDDNDMMRDSLAETVRRAGHEASAFSSPRAALQELAGADPQAVVTDLMMPGMTGIEFLAEVKRQSPEAPVILVTAFATIETAVQAMKQGAYDYITKPFEAAAFESLLGKALEHRALLAENETLRAQVTDTRDRRPALLTTRSKAMQQLLEQLEKVAKSSATVLVRGESGVGKEVISRELHRRSLRAAGPFFAVNCAALSAGLLESELFGHEKGAFTGADRLRKGRFELAAGGTLLLDEVSEIDPNLQAKLLRVLQERSFERVGSSVARKADVRVIATTNRDLKTAIAEKKFREDLYYRLNVVTLQIPPLRERPDDIPELVRYLISEAGRDMGKPMRGVDAAALRLLQVYAWPGNVRELRNVIERAVVLAGGDMLGPADFQGVLEDGAAPAAAATGVFVPRKLEAVEREVIEQSLRHFHWNQAKCAEALGISDRTLRTKIKEWGLERN